MADICNFNDEQYWEAQFKHFIALRYEAPSSKDQEAVCVRSFANRTIQYLHAGACSMPPQK